MVQLLVIGYGNMLRGDDGAGRNVAEQLAEMRMPQVSVHACHQLVPELVEETKEAAKVLFIDAAASTGKPLLQRITPRVTVAALAHICDPAGLLTLCRTLHERCPEAWILTIPGSHFDIGEKLSLQAQSNAIEALALARDWCERNA